MEKQLRIMMIGAHCDDCDFQVGGLALQYLKAGHKVKFLVLCNGCGGHHELSPEATAHRRRGETLNVAAQFGMEYDVWEDMPDCELMATQENRQRLIREIRAYQPDVIFAHRTNDYHADHRNAALLVQDASYLLIVPNYVSDAPAMPQMPVILHYWDHFRYPPFHGDIAIGIDEFIDDKFLMMDFHKSQVYEWLPWTYGELDQVPQDPSHRLDWLHGERIDRNAPPDDAAVLNYVPPRQGKCEYQQAYQASKYRDLLVKRYGERGQMIHFAEVFEVSEYGSPLTPELEKELFPF